ncbi:MAG: HD domain-containing protein [Bacteroidales bacterium]|nr:HD domain-containing protein [Bacteroidales bacterium]MDD3907608.1 HD domain-containing protein [Bacteroidales bacterium]MDD4712719.1 HD domain-containing protein [Bacteroidales bacterium]
MEKRKIINDPVFGFINLPSGFLNEVFQHRYLQRLTRIKQLGMSSFVYPGAQHTRFQHTTGAMFLMEEAIQHLRSKGNVITPEESEAVIAAIILHDIGHGPFSHVLEDTIIHGISHEELSLMLMERMNREFGGKLDLAIRIFKDEYSKKFLHQLVSGNLDMDRLDYLRRDSFFTGVTEGNIGSARIIKMLNVQDDRLVVEAKGIYSIENFLLSRRLMYWQVYLHKTSLAAEKMLQNLLNRARALTVKGVLVPASEALGFFLANKQTNGEMDEEALDFFEELDDTDIWSAIKMWQYHEDFVLSTLSQGLLQRKLFKIEMSNDAPDPQRITRDLETIASTYGITTDHAKYFISQSCVSTNMYSEKDDSIDILYNNGNIRPITKASDMLNLELLSREVQKQIYCHLRL